MKIISVTSPCNGSGKTSLITAITRSFPGVLTVIKFTTVYRDGVFCPETNNGCACRSLRGPFTIITDPEIVAQPDTDTGRIYRSAAKRTIWCVTRPASYAQLWRVLLQDYLHEENFLLTEGNAFALAVKPDLLLLVFNPHLPQKWWKESTYQLAERADYIIVNKYRPQGPSPHQAISPVDIRTPKALAVTAQPCEEISVWKDQRLYQKLCGLLRPRDPLAEALF